jgi:hypothetical protein
MADGAYKLKKSNTWKRKRTGRGCEYVYAILFCTFVVSSTIRIPLCNAIYKSLLFIYITTAATTATISATIPPLPLPRPAALFFPSLFDASG